MFLRLRMLLHLVYTVFVIVMLVQPLNTLPIITTSSTRDTTSTLAQLSTDKRNVTIVQVPKFLLAKNSTNQTMGNVGTGFTDHDIPINNSLEHAESSVPSSGHHASNFSQESIQNNHHQSNDIHAMDHDTRTSSNNSADNVIPLVPQQGTKEHTKTLNTSSARQPLALGSIESNEIEVKQDNSQQEITSPTALRDITTSHDHNDQNHWPSNSYHNGTSDQLSGDTISHRDQVKVTTTVNTVNETATSVKSSMQQLEAKLKTNVNRTKDIDKKEISEQDDNLSPPLLMESSPGEDQMVEFSEEQFPYERQTNAEPENLIHITAANDQNNTWNTTKLTIVLKSHEDSVTVLWSYESNDTQVTGFLVTYRINKREHYDSSKLGKNVRSFTLHSLHEDEDYVICVHAMVNTTPVKEACAHWNETSMKIVVGIMAGVLFLVPCIIIVIWIIAKDRKVRKKMACIHEAKQKLNLSDFQQYPAGYSLGEKDTGKHKSRSGCETKEKMENCFNEEHTDSEDELWRQQTHVEQHPASHSHKPNNGTLRKTNATVTLLKSDGKNIPQRTD